MTDVYVGHRNIGTHSEHRCRCLRSADSDLKKILQTALCRAESKCECKNPFTNGRRGTCIAAQFDQRTLPQPCQHVVGGLPSLVYGMGGHTDVKATEAGAVDGFKFPKCPQEIVDSGCICSRTQICKKMLRLAEWRNSRKFADVDGRASSFQKHNFGQVLTICETSLSHYMISCSEITHCSPRWYNRQLTLWWCSHD